MNPVPTSSYCPNCHYPLRATAHYCHHCGQKRTEKRITLGALIGDFFSTLFNFDGKVLRTLGALFVPGKLTEAYFAGRHQRYVKPMRLFLSLATVFLALLIFVAPEQQNDKSSGGITEVGEQIRRNVDHHALAVRMDTVRRRLAVGASPETERAMDELYLKFWATERAAMTGDSTQLFTREVLRIEFKEDDADIDSLLLLQPRASNEEWLQLAPDVLADKYGVDNWIDRFLIRRQARFIQTDGNFNRFILGNLFWLFVFLPLVLALIFKLLYIRRKRYYVEHLVFNLHYYSLVFLLTFLALIPGVEASKNIVFIMVGVGAIYYYLALRRVYRQGWFKTFVKQVLSVVLLQFMLIPVLLLWVLVNALLF